MRTSRPSFTKPRSMIRDSSVTSILPPPITTATVFPASENLPVEQRGYAGRSRAFGQQLLRLEQSQDGAGDLFIVHGDQFVNVFLNQFERAHARLADGNAVGDGSGGGSSTG